MAIDSIRGQLCPLCTQFSSIGGSRKRLPSNDCTWSTAYPTLSLISQQGVRKQPQHVSSVHDSELAAVEADRVASKFRNPWYDVVVTAETVSKLCEQGHLVKAVEAVGILVESDCSVSRSLFYTVLKECVGQKDVVVGRRVHAFIVKRGYQADTFLCNHILRMYASHGRLQDAMDVFTMVATPDAFMWSSIISAHVKQGQDTQAIQLYHSMRRSSVKPDGHVFVAALQACARGRDLESGQEVHAHVLASGMESDLFVCSCLVDMYAKCGSLEDARRVFDGLGRKDVVTWNAMIAGYSQQGMGHEALCLFRAMQAEGSALPNSVTYLSVLQACARVGNPALEVGKRLHVRIREQGCRSDILVANSLVNMYAKCGSLEDAQSVFDGLDRKDVVSWNAIIAGYSQLGMGQRALQLYDDMREEAVVAPNSVTYVCLLQACAGLGNTALEKGRQINSHITERGHEVGVVMANSLVNMYAKCGSLEDAQRVFDEAREKDVVTWNSLLAGYSQQDMGHKALSLYKQMKVEGITAPNSVTFVCLLQACASVGAPALEMGKQLHAEIKEWGPQGHAFVANSLVNMYAKCGSFENAQRIFEGLSQKDVVTWNAMLSGYSKQGMAQEVIRLYDAMQEEGTVTPDSVTFVCLLKACASLGSPALGIGKQLHSQIREQGHQADAFVANSLVNMYAKCGSLEDAQIVFDELVEKDVVTWTVMIAGYSKQGMGQEALRLSSDMQEEGIAVPDSVTFVCLLQACTSLGTQALETGKQLHVEIIEQGHQDDVFVANSLVNMYAKCGSLEDAQNVFDGLSHKDVVTWNALMSGYSQEGMVQEVVCLYNAMLDEGMSVPDPLTFVCLLQTCASVGSPALEEGKQIHARIWEQGHQADVFVANNVVNMYAKCGSLEDAQRVFEELDDKDVVTWNAIITAYAQQGMGQEALHLYSVMQEEDAAVPDSVTFVSLLQACASLAALSLGRQLHARIEALGLQADVFVARGLINMYGKSGSMVDAHQVFEVLAERDVVTWSALMAGYTGQGNSRLVFELIQRMKEDGIQPDGITFLSVLTACSHARLLDKGMEYFEAMSRDYGITPTVEHYTCMVDLLGRAGQLNEAIALIRSMPVLPNAAVWYTLLGSCQKWNNVEVGRHCFDEALKLNQKDSAAYVLMSNIYNGAHMWEQAQAIQVRRKEIRAWKQPGQSWWTDMEGFVHSFLVGDENDPRGNAKLD